jgi:DNA-binding MarR family transcriptional regulator
MQILLYLVNHEHPPRVSDLAAEFDVTLATVSDALAAPRRKDLVHREQGAADWRSSVFTITITITGAGAT